MANGERLSLKDKLRTIPRWILPTVVGGVLILIMLWKIPERQIESYAREFSHEDLGKLTPNERVQLRKSLIDAKNSARTTLAQIIGGLVLLGGLYFTWRNAKTAQETLRVTEEGKLTERFSKAVELLGSEKLDVRLGGIYALERIAKDSQPDHWTVMEVLTAFVREKSKKEFQGYYQSLKRLRNLEEAVPIEEILQFKTSTDVQAALTVIGRRNPKWIEQETLRQQLDFREAVLINVDAVGLTLNRAIFNHANLSNANFHSTGLTGAFFNGTTLMDTKFTNANICGAIFWDVKDLCYVDLLNATRDKNTDLPKEIKDKLEEHEIAAARFSQELKNGSLDTS